LPEWIPELLQQAIARIELNYASNHQSTDLLSLEEDSAAMFLDQPTISWDTFGTPHFTCRLVHLSFFNLRESVYNIMVGDRICGSLRQDADGIYRASPSDEITLPLTSPLLVASLVASDGSIVQNQTLQLWNESEDISVFAVTTGTPIDPWKHIMTPQKSYYLLLSADLEIQPPPVSWHHLNTRTRLYLLEKNWPAHTQVLLEGAALWQPKLSFASVPEVQLHKDALEIRLYDTFAPLTFARPLRLQISHPHNYIVAFLRSAGQPISFHQHTATLTVTEPIILQPSMFSFKNSTALELIVGVRSTTSQTLTRLPYAIEIALIGVALLSKDGWIPLDATQSLNIEDAKRQLMRFYLLDAENWPLLEGDTWIDNAWQKPKSLQASVGLGAPLKVQRSAYNASALDQPQQVVAEVINTGCLKTIRLEDEWNISERTLDVQLTRPIEPDQAHAIVWWDQAGTYILLQPEHWEFSQEDGMHWSVILPALCTHPLAIGIAYAGSWLGTWYSKDWSQILSISSSLQAPMLAALIRWFHLPIMSQDIFHRVQQFSCTYALETLPTWLQEQCPLPDLQFTSGDDGWLAAIRIIFFDWQPTSNVGNLVDRLADPSPLNDPLTLASQMVWKLARVNPILMAKTVHAWIKRICIPQWGIAQSSTLIKQLLHEIAELHKQESLAKKQNILIQELATVMNVDTNFIQRSLLERALPALHGHAIAPIDRENIAVAMQIEPFRRLQSIYLLKWIYQRINAR
jgi:hypothetical protein